MAEINGVDIVRPNPGIRHGVRRRYDDKGFYILAFEFAEF